MRMCILDLEMEQPCNSLLEIGAVILDLRRGISETFSRFIQLDSGEMPSEYITNLCNIDHDEYSLAAVPGKEALEDFWEFLEKSNCGNRLYSWGGDHDWILNYSTQYGVMTPKRLRTLDIKQMTEPLRFMINKKSKGGLVNSLHTFGLEFEGTQHMALTDAINTAILFKKICDDYSKLARAKQILLEKGKY